MRISPICARLYLMNAPVMKPGTVEMVPVEWIMQNAVGSVDGFYDYDEDGASSVDYLEMVLYKGQESQMGGLVHAILTEGFRIPIVLVLDKDDYGLTGKVIHGNGHHRMVAAILLCLAEIPVFWSPDHDDYMCEYASEGPDVYDYRGEWDSLCDEVAEMFGY